MVQRVSTVAFEGIEARAVDVQVQVAPGLPAFNIVGLPDKAVSEAKERVRAALVASGLALPSEGSREVAARVARARDIQLERYAALGLDNVGTNAQAHGPVLEEIARAEGSGLTLLGDAADSMRLSARGYHRVLRVARTLADLDGAEKVGRVHLAEALSYRALADEVRRAA